MNYDTMATKSIIPFTRERQIYDRTGNMNGNANAVNTSMSTTATSTSSTATTATLSTPTSLPGWPTVHTNDTRRIFRLLRDEFYATQLESVARRLWILTTPSSQNIRALHAQKVLGRDIVVTEDPGLHLVWSGKRVFVKPLPAFLMSWDVWKECLTAKNGDGGLGLEGDADDVRRAALGFLRSYRWLIRHESDFRIAVNSELQLVPEGVKWGDLSSFLDEVVDSVDDGDVSGRYHYGELRLSRLNLYAPLLFRRFNYVHMPMEYSEYFTRLWAPVLVTFVIISTMLDTMQVALASGQSISAPVIISNVFYWFSIVALILIVGVLVLSGSIWGLMIAQEFHYSLWRLRHWKLKKNR